MTDLLRELAEGCTHVQPHWDPATVDRALARLQQRIRRRRAYRVLALTGVVATAAGTWWARPVSQPERSRGDAEYASAPAIVSPREVRFHDGSIARPLDADTAITLVEDTPSRTTAALERGVGQFEVQRRSGRVFRVTAGDVSIHVLGTAFTVDRTESAVGVWVNRGTVRVEWPGGAARLGAGDHGWFPSSRAGGGPILEPQPTEAGSASAMPAPARGTRPAPAIGWLHFAEMGRYSDAYAILRTVPSNRLRDPESLLTAADVARLSGHPDAAVTYFERVLARHAADSRAPVAAFSLGRILLNSLRRPGEAAARFAQARHLSPTGSLAQDALAREVEAWSRAGLPTNARAAAEEYLTRYPRGRWALAVRRYGGVD